MNWYITPYTLLLLLPPLLSTAIAAVAWRRRATRGARPLVWLALSAAVWGLTYFLALHSTNLPDKLFWNSAQYLGVAVAPAAWLVFAIEYTGRGGLLTKRIMALLAIMPLLIIVLVWTNSSHGLYYSDPSLTPTGPFITLRLSRGPLFLVNLVYSYSLLLAGTLLILKAFLQAPPWLRAQTGVVLVGGLVPWVVNALHQSRLIPLDLTPFSFSLTGLAMLWGLAQLWLVELRPVAREAVIRAMDDGMIVLDAQHRIVNLNPAAERILGCPAVQAIGQPAATAVPQWIELSEPRTNPALAHLEISLPGEKGQPQRLYDVRSSPLRGPHGVTAGYLLAWRDITERKQTEEALRVSHADLQARNEELDAFAHTVAHDLRGSLSIVVSAASLLKRDRASLSPVEIEMWLRSILNHGTKMSYTTDALLLLARVRGEQVPIDIVEMGSIVAGACQRLAGKIEQHQVEIITPPTWPVAAGYGPWLEEVWFNLIDNAIKYGGLPPRVELGYARPDRDGKDVIEFWVRDNGSGLTPEEQARLFVPFSTLPRSRGTGYGLGLSIVRRIVEKLGGQVRVHSEGVPDRGSVLSFTLPGMPQEGI